MAKTEIYGHNRVMINPAWLAGFFDGDGTVGIYRRKARNGHPEEWFLRVSIGQKNREVLDHIQDQHGGHLRHRGSTNSHGTYGEVWELIWTHRKAGEILDLIAPYSLVKTLEIVIAQEFRSIKNSPGKPNAPREQYRKLAAALKHVKSIRNSPVEKTSEAATPNRVDEAG